MNRNNEDVLTILANFFTQVIQNLNYIIKSGKITKKGKLRNKYDSTRTN